MMQLDQIVMAALRFKGTATTAYLRNVVHHNLKHTRGLSDLLEHLRTLRVVTVENHGDKESREAWTWIGLDSPVGKFKAKVLEVEDKPGRKPKRRSPKPSPSSS